MGDNDHFGETTNRRRLLTGTLAGTAGGLLSGCLGRQRYQPNRGSGDETTTIKQVYPSYFDTADEQLRDKFDALTDFDFEVVGQVTTARATSARSYYLSQFNAQSSRFDVGSMDVVWPAEFVANDWIKPLDDPNGYLDTMIDPAVDAVTIDGTAYGMPLHTDANVLFYRKDLLDGYGFSPPTTYDELIAQAQEIVGNEDDIENGYLWQGGENEGLTVNWLNWLWGMEGSVYDSSDSIQVNSQKGVDALQHAVDLIYQDAISPESVTSGSSESDALQFGQGNTVFMRNWPFAIRNLNNESISNVAGQFEVAPLPTHRDYPEASNSCLGGWSFFVNRNSYNEKEAEQFVSYSGSLEIQQFLANKFSLLPVRQELYDQASEDSLLGRFSQVLDRVRRRPAVAEYQVFSEILYTEANRALRREKPPRAALDDAQEQIEDEGIGESLADA
jgi:multiple sugar transport system substrate-binding protein